LSINKKTGGILMKLIIRRDQADVKGLLGGHKGVNFSLFTQANITDEESALIKRYKVGDQIIASYQRPKKGQSEMLEFYLSVNDIVNGRTITMDSIITLLDLEETIKKGCKNLKDLLAVMSTFGGEEIVEI